MEDTSLAPSFPIGRIGGQAAAATAALSCGYVGHGSGCLMQVVVLDMDLACLSQRWALRWLYRRGSSDGWTRQSGGSSSWRCWSPRVSGATLRGNARNRLIQQHQHRRKRHQHQHIRLRVVLLYTNKQNQLQSRTLGIAYKNIKTMGLKSLCLSLVLTLIITVLFVCFDKGETSRLTWQQCEHNVFFDIFPC